MAAPTEADDASAERLYGRPQHEGRADGQCVEKVTYGEPQHESGRERASDFELVRVAALSIEGCDSDRPNPYVQPPMKGAAREVSGV